MLAPPKGTLRLSAPTEMIAAGRVRTSEPAPRFSASLLLAGILEMRAGGEAPPVLSHKVQTEGLSLRDAFVRLTVAEQDSIRRHFSPALLEELFSLASESDARILFSDLTNLGVRLYQDRQPETAMTILSSITHVLAEEFPGRPESHGELAARTQRELDAMLGRGAWAPRVEYLARGVLREAADPIALASMGTACLAFSAVRLGALARLTAGGRSGLGVRLLANAIGFSAEVPAFVFSGKGLRELTGSHQDWRLSAVGRELASAGLTLGGLKLVGGLTGSLARRGLEAGFGTRYANPIQALAEQGGMLGGIYLGHWLERQAGLVSPGAGGNTLVDNLGMLLQFNIAGRLMESGLGQHFARLQHNLHLRSEILANRPRPVTDILSPQSAAWARVDLSQRRLSKDGAVPSLLSKATRSVANRVKDLYELWKHQAPNPFLLMGASFLFGKKSRGLSAATVERLERYYDSLSPFAQRGIDILVQQVGLPKKYANDFLLHAEEHLAANEVSQILENITLLHELGVKGLATGFLPTSYDPKFFSMDQGRIRSTLSEYDEAYWRASQGTDKVKLAPKLDVDWSQLRPDETAYLEREILPLLGSYEPKLAANFRRQGSVEIDLGLYDFTQETLRRIVEVKRSSREIFEPPAVEEAKILLQIFRLSLLVRQHRLEGLEYVFHAAELSPRFQARLEEVLHLTGTPYQIWSLHQNARKLLRSHQLEPLRARPAKPARKRAKSPDVSGKSVSADSNLPWTSNMKNFLEPAIADFSVRPLDTVEAFMAQMIKHLRYPAQQALVQKIEETIRKNGIPHAAEVRMLFDHFKKTRANTLSRHSILTLVKIVALLCGESIEKVSLGNTLDTVVADPLLEALRLHKARVERSLTKALDQFETVLWVVETTLDENGGRLSSEESQSSLDLLAEAFPHHSVAGPNGEEWYLPKLAEVIRAYPELAWDGKIKKRLETSLQKHEELLHRVEGSEKDAATATEETPTPAQDAWLEFNANDLPALAPEYLLRYPELELVSEAAMDAEAKELASVGDRLFNRKSRPLLALLALLRQHGGSLQGADREALEELRLAVLTSTDLESLAQVTDTAYREYETHLRDVLTDELSWSLIGNFPEIRETGGPVTGMAAVYALQNYLSKLLLPPDLRKSWIQSVETFQRQQNPGEPWHSFQPLARFYLQNRERILTSAPWVLEAGDSTPGTSSPVPELERLAGDAGPVHPGISNVGVPWRSLFAPIFHSAPAKSGVPALQAKFLEISRWVQSLCDTGASRDHMVAWGEGQMRNSYLEQRRRVLGYLTQKIGVKDLLESFPEFRDGGAADGEASPGWGPLPQPPTFRLRGYEILEKIDRLLQRHEGTSLGVQWQVLLSSLEPPDLVVRNQGPEKLVEDAAQKLLQFYLQHREEILAAPSTLRRTKRASTDPDTEKLWELDLLKPASDPTRLDDLTHMVRLFSQDPLEYEVYFTLPSRQVGQVFLSARTLGAIRTQQETFPVPGFEEALSASDIDRVVRYHPELYNMREILTVMLSRKTAAMARAILRDDFWSRSSLNQTLEKELRRTAMLLVLGLSPERVLPTLESHIREIYRGNREEILGRLFADSGFMLRALDVPELNSMPAQEWAYLIDEAARSLLNPLDKAAFQIMALLARPGIPEDMVPSISKMRRTLMSAPARIKRQALFQFYLENRQKILRAFGLPSEPY